MRMDSGQENRNQNKQKSSKEARQGKRLEEVECSCGIG